MPPMMTLASSVSPALRTHRSNKHRQAVPPSPRGCSSTTSFSLPPTGGGSVVQLAHGQMPTLSSPVNCPKQRSHIRRRWWAPPMPQQRKRPGTSRQPGMATDAQILSKRWHEM
eukprot:scaffold27_cov125-Isochrysis_galbana.AAC.1